MRHLHSRGLRAALALVVLSAGLAGCGGNNGRPKVVKAGGQVLYKGQPVEGAVVTFTNEAANTSAYARTGPDGRFQLTTFGHEDGAVPGPQKVVVSKIEVTERPKPDVDYNTSSQIPPPPEQKQLLPPKYTSTATSDLQFEVRAGDKNDFILDLK
jgi:hypothetical protein